MVSRIARATLFAAASVAIHPFGGVSAAPRGIQERQEMPKVPKDSVLVVIDGCVKGRVLRAVDVHPVDTTSGVSVRQRTFRLAGRKDAMKDVKAVDGQRAELTGLIKKSALIEPGLKVMGGRVQIGGASGGVAGSPGSLPDPAENVVVLDVARVQPVGGSCGG